MKTFILLLVCISAAYGLLTLQKQAYLKFPYNMNNNFGLLTNAAHAAAYHVQQRILYVLGAQSDSNTDRILFVVDMNNPSTPQILYRHTFTASDNGRANDVAVCPDTVAVSLEAVIPTNHGHVEFFTPFQRGDTSLVLTGREPVGVDPKGMAFTSDCQKLVIANEGRGGNSFNTFVDPPGTVTIMLRNDVGPPAFVNINFQPYVESNTVGALLNRGIRWVYRGNPNNGIVNNMWDDFEPERVAISLDQNYAYVSMPENNAVAKININSYSVSNVFPLGNKNWMNYQIDASDSDGGPNVGSGRQLMSMYQATGLAISSINNQEYLFSANQGQIKKYTAAQGDEFDESRRSRTIATSPNLGSGRQLMSMYQATGLEITSINNQEYLFSANQGQIKKYTAVQGDEFDESRRSRTIFADGEFDSNALSQDMLNAVNNNSVYGRLFLRYSDSKDFITGNLNQATAYGGRSFAMWQTPNLTLFYDSGDDFEVHEQQTYPGTFNGEANNANQSPTQQRDQRSDDFGPEPTSIAAGKFGALPFIVVGTRTGLLHVYAENNLLPIFQSVHREGSTTQTWQQLYDNDMAGDVLITDIGIIESTESPDGNTYVYVIGSGSGSLGVYRVVSA